MLVKTSCTDVYCRKSGGNSYMPWKYILAVQYNIYFYITVIRLQCVIQFALTT